MIKDNATNVHKLQLELDKDLESLYKDIITGKVDAHYEANSRNSVMGNRIKLLGLRQSLLKDIGKLTEE